MKLIDIRGEPQLYQWETGRIIDFDCNVDVIEWETPLLKNALPIKPDAENYTSIPDELLQTSAAITVYAKKNGSVVETATFSVDARKKPLDYIYTPSKVQTLQALADKIAELEKTGGATDEQIENAVEKYLEENPIDVIVSEEQIESVVDKYLEENPPEVGGTVETVNGIKPDENGNINLPPYVKRDEVHEAISELMTALNIVDISPDMLDFSYFLVLTADMYNTVNDIPNVYVDKENILLSINQALFKVMPATPNLQNAISQTYLNKEDITDLQKSLGDINSILATLVDVGGVSE